MHETSQYPDAMLRDLSLPTEAWNHNLLRANLRNSCTCQIHLKVTVSFVKDTGGEEGVINYVCVIEIHCSTPSVVFHVKHELNVTVASVEPDNCNYKCRLMRAKMGAIVPLVTLLANTLTKC